MRDRTDRFFAWVWRINGLLLLALAASGLVGALVVAIDVALLSSRDRPTDQLATIAGADIAASDLRLGSFYPIAGTQLLYAPLAPPSEYIGSGSSGGLGAARNILFFDTRTKQAHWLLPDNTKVISSYQFLLDPPVGRDAWDEGEAGKREQRATALLLELRDGEASARKSRSIAVATPEGRALSTIAKASDGMLGYHQLAREAVLVFYVSHGAARVLDLDPITRAVRSDGLLSTGDPEGTAARPNP